MLSFGWPFAVSLFCPKQKKNVAHDQNNFRAELNGRVPRRSNCDGAEGDYIKRAGT
jgi:hypothetical protein